MVGWTPSSFVSSRSSRIEKREARPEDFMDEEDLEVNRENIYTSAWSLMMIHVGIGECKKACCYG